MEASDAVLVSQARAGDEQAFRLLVERHSHAVFRLAFRITGNEQDAEDAVQEAFLRAFTQLDRFQDRSAFGTWIYRIAANCAVDVLRERARHARRRDDEAGVSESMASDDADPERVTLGREYRRRVEETMGRLSPLERAAFGLRHFEGRSIAEIGELLGLGESAAKHSIFRAVKKIRLALQPSGRAVRVRSRGRKFVEVRFGGRCADERATGTGQGRRDRES